MAKKSYAVKVGRQPGIYDSWDACRAEVHGFPGAVYKSFSTRQEAEAWLQGASGMQAIAPPGRPEREGELVSYVDGSFNGQHYAFGAVLLSKDEERLAARAFRDAEAAQLHNVAGELAGATFAMAYALEHGYRSLIICHDYTGIAHWCSGDWKANLRLTQAYRDYAQAMSKRLEIQFVKVPAHKGIHYNELADRLAKTALAEDWTELVIQTIDKD